MLGLVRTSITNLTADRSSSRNVLRIFQFLLCGLCAAIGISIYFKSTDVMHDSITCSTTVTLNYIHQTDGKK
jgi:flagellar biosynthesis protein FliR